MNLAGLRAAALRREPYEWGFLRDGFDLDHAARLLATFPRAGFWELTGTDAEKSWTYAARPLVTLDAGGPALAGALHPEWRGVAQQLENQSYRQALSQAIGRDLSHAGVEASVWRWDVGTNLGPHRDMASKIVTQVFYFNVGWDPRWGGCLRILGSREPDDLIQELPPRLGSSSILVRSESSWHSVTPVSASAPAARLSLIVTWFEPGAESPVWKVGADGRVGCVASGEPMDAVAAGG
ncbi:MAG TPA: 2OG-Fe(II) oxygenase family protein [Solirubrobacteraceae bacterium]